MFARISKFKVKAGRLDDLMAQRDEQKQLLETLPGLNYLFWLSGQDSEYQVVAIYESRSLAESEAAMEIAGKFWFKMANLIEAKREVRLYDVTHFESFSPT
jgi:heme-degrading monooxygenase HmoA